MAHLHAMRPSCSHYQSSRLGTFPRLTSAQHQPEFEVQVVVRGKLCKVVGYGGMNMHMIDITSVPDARVSCRPCLCSSESPYPRFQHVVLAHVSPFARVSW